MDGKDELCVGVCGIGGYAGTIADHLLRVGAECSPRLRLAAACDPDRWRLNDRVAKLQAAGVDVDEHFDQLLDRQNVHGVWLPLPIGLHRPFTERALAAGKHVMCEKPAAGTVDDVDAMIAALRDSDRSLLIGFQDVYDPTTAQVKQLLLDGVIGDVTHVTLHACWPRDDSYFRRSAWAGRVWHNDAWILDSPANNALSHFINVALLLLGPTFHESAQPVHIEAELYRAAPIENYDTISARATLSSGVTLLVLLTHACADVTDAIIRIHGKRGSIERLPSSYRIRRDHDERVIPRGSLAQTYQHMVHAWARAMKGASNADELLATLDIARSQALFVSGASDATPVYSIDPRFLNTHHSRRDQTVIAIPNIDLVFEHCAERNLMLHESGRLEFTQPPGRLNLTGYRHFSGELAPRNTELGLKQTL